MLFYTITEKDYLQGGPIQWSILALNLLYNGHASGCRSVVGWPWAGVNTTRAVRPGAEATPTQREE